MNWVRRILDALARPAPLLPPELLWRAEIIAGRDGQMHFMVANYDEAEHPEIYAACAQLSVEAAKRTGLQPDVLLGALAQKYLRQTTSHLSGKKLIVAK